MPTIGTWNMQGANVEKWQTMVKSYMTMADAMCLQECGGPPLSATPLPAVVPISNPPGGGAPPPVVPTRWTVGSGGAALYILCYNFGDTPGSRCNLAVVTKLPPVYWWVVWAPFGAVWRPAVGATLPDGSAVFSVHAISPNGPDAPAVVGAIASLASHAPAPPRAWYVGGDFNREPPSWGGQANISPPNQPTYSTRAPVSKYDYAISSNPANTAVTGWRLDETAPWSDHFAVHFPGLQ